jgi:hypothetical protein
VNQSDNFKIFWWFVLVVTIAIFLAGRYDALVKGTPTYFDSIVFLVWIGLCLAPVFKDINIFGLKLKTELEDLKKDLNYQLSILKTEIKSSIEVSAANSNQIYVNTNQQPPKDSEIPDLSAHIKEALSKLGITPESTWSADQVIESIEVEMFKIRLQFEKLVRRYAWFKVSDNRRYSLGRMLQELKYSEAIPKDILIGVQEIVSICNYAVHGDELTKAQIEFVRESAPGLLKALEANLREAF